MKRGELRKISNWSEAAREEMDRHLSLSPEERLRIALELIERAYGPRESWIPIRSVPPRKLRHFSPCNRSRME